MSNNDDDIISRFILLAALRRTLHTHLTEGQVRADLVDLTRQAADMPQWKTDLEQYQAFRSGKEVFMPPWLYTDYSPATHNRLFAHNLGLTSIADIELINDMLSRAVAVVRVTKHLVDRGRLFDLGEEGFATDIEQPVGRFISQLKRVALRLNLSLHEVVQLLKVEVKGLDSMPVGDLVIIRVNRGVLYKYNTVALPEALPEIDLTEDLRRA